MQRRIKLICYCLIPITLVVLLMWFVSCRKRMPDDAASDYPDETKTNGGAARPPMPEARPPMPEARPPMQDEIPKFPWPPPKASATADIPQHFFSSPPDDVLRLHHVKKALHDALESCGYYEKNYYRIPKGFAMVTRLEQINQDGTSKEPPDRWVVEAQPLRKFSLSKYLAALFTANPGYYRIIVFAVTFPFSQTDEIISRKEAGEWLKSGLNELPDSIGQLEYSKKHTCTALIYEFELPNPGEPGELKDPSIFQGRTHLVKAGIWKALEN